ncbi:MAG: peptide deformylase [Mariprofundaceae bacterium]|nr:peptide deformylase [Mariprofundaceae bacterium]
MCWKVVSCNNVKIAVKDILTLPDAMLRKTSNMVESFDSALNLLVEDMQIAMLNGAGGVGIAAPQLGCLQRVILVDCSLGRFPCRNHGRVLMVNPEIIDHSGKVLGREGCLSVPKWMATVSRSKKITVRYQDSLCEFHELVGSGFEARVIQHELDHLNGVLFIDRVLSVHDLVRRM